jgi:flagellar M-ring protein FliF
VRVAVDLNWDTITRTEEKFDPDGQVARSSTINDDTTETATSAATGGAPGMAANNAAAEGASNAPAAALPVNSSITKKKVTTSTYEINKITSNMLQAAGGVKRISSAVFIAQRFEGKGADRKALPRTPKELDDIKSIVKSALGIQENGDASRKDEITLEEMPFNDQTATEITQQFEQQDKRQFWIELAPKLIYPALAIGIIFMFWRMLKNTKVDDIPLGVPIGHGNGIGNGHYAKPGAPGSGMVTVDVLNQLVRDNPANMTQAVRAWMTRTKPNN